MRDSDINFFEVQDWLEEYKYSNNEKVKSQLKNLIALRCMPFVKRVARGLARRSTDPVEDLVQIGSMGLIKAIDFFDPKVSRNFKTYATYLITGEIRHYLRDKVSMIKAPREIQELSFRVRQVILGLTQELGIAPSNEQIADRLHITIRKIEEVKNIERRKQTLSLDQVVSNTDHDYLSLGDHIEDTNYEMFLNKQENIIMLKDAIYKLPEQLQEVIFFHFFEGLSQREIAPKLAISQMQVSRRIRKALNILFDLIVDEKQELRG